MLQLLSVLFRRLLTWYANPIYVTGLLPYPLKTRGYLIFSGGIERDRGMILVNML